MKCYKCHWGTWAMTWNIEMSVWDMGKDMDSDIKYWKCEYGTCPRTWSIENVTVGLGQGHAILKMSYGTWTGLFIL